MKCNFCKSKAVVNYQKTWVKYKITKGDDYKIDSNFNGLDVEDISINENLHLCKKHEKIWLNDEIQILKDTENS